MTFYLFRLCFKRKTINFNELCFITYAGMIRGAIAFALVLKIPVIDTPECTQGDGCLSKVNYDLLVSTTLILVMMTTLIFGTLMGKIQTILVPPTAKDEEEYHEMERKQSAIMSKSLMKRRASSIFNESHHEILVHPNEEKGVDDSMTSAQLDNEPASWPTSRFVRWFTLYDENVLKPFFIRKYRKEVQLLEDEYQELVR
jgi:NhaP-type Na+/H+ or K+/H+ antiporter